MSIVETTPETEATGLVAELFSEDVESLGYVPSHTKVMALNPEAVRAFEALARSVVASLGLRRYELVTLAAAKALGSDACLMAHGLKSLSIMDADELEAIAIDHRTAGLDDAEVAMMDFAIRLSTDSSSMSDADSGRLRAAGLTDREIVDIALAAALRNFYSRALHALAVEPDVPPSLPRRLREALIGRD